MAGNRWFMKALEIFEKMDENEKTAKSILMEKIDTYPRDFFSKKSVDELNEHFGANTDIKVTENVREYMDCMLKSEEEWDKVLKTYYDLPDKEEDDEENEDSADRMDADEEVEVTEEAGETEETQEDDDYADLIDEGFFTVKPLTKNEFIEKYGYDFEMREDEKPGFIRNVNETTNRAFKKRCIEYYRDELGIDPKDIGIKV